MKRTVLVCIAIVLIAVVFVTAFLVRSGDVPVKSDDKTVYVGVTYCGNSVSDAKQLIDKVKNFTNLFILQSGSLQTSNESINQIGDYAVKSGLHFINYMGVSSFALANNWLSGYNGRWGDDFLGIYLNDEPGGKMLDDRMYLYNPNTQQSFTKTEDGIISNYFFNNTNANYMRDGTVNITTWTNQPPYNSKYFTYYKNGTVTTQTQEDSPGVVVSNASSLPYTYDELWQACPIRTGADASALFVAGSNSTISHVRTEYKSSFRILTSDYALQWFDYQSGYDAVLTEFCWNQSITQDIALARGAANVFGKDWGAMITWKYTEAPYLGNGAEMYQQMCTAYENGAKYIVVFNYAPGMQGPYGTLTGEHFDALQRFWTDEVNNASVTPRQVKADTAFVLPQNYGSGLRRQGDIVWGMWAANDTDSQIWQHMQNALSTYGEKLNIVYDDPAHPAAGRYSQVIYCNETDS
jgi:hypothetical protein